MIEAVIFSWILGVIAYSYLHINSLPISKFHKGVMVFGVGSLTVSLSVISLKYSDLRDAYQRAETERIDWCVQYHEERDRVETFQYEIQSKDSIINRLEDEIALQWDENAIFSSMLAQIENEPGGSGILRRLWKSNH